MFSVTENKTISRTLTKLQLIYHHWGGLVYFALFTLFHFIVWAVQAVTWRLTGVHQHWEKACAGQCDNKSAHVLNILHTFKPTDLEKIRPPWHFFSVHESFQHPDIVFRDDVMLIDVSYTKAMFIQLPKTLDHYGPSTHPLLFITLHKEAVKLIEVPLKIFHKLAEKVGDPTKHFEQVTILFHLGRCGSTLLTRMYEEAAPDAIVYSEPPTFFEFYWYSNTAPKDFYLPALRSSLYLFLKPVANKKRAFIRNVFFVSHIAKDVHAVLPNARYIYMHRDPIRVIWAHERAFSNSPFYFLLYLVVITKLWPKTYKLGYNRYALTEHACNVAMKTSMFEFSTLFWAHFWFSYKEQAEHFDYPAVYYDALFEDRVEFCRNFMKLVKLPETRLNDVLSVLDSDAQEGFVIGQSALKNVSVTPYSPELRKRTDLFMDMLSLPRLNWNPYVSAKDAYATGTCN